MRRSCLVEQSFSPPLCFCSFCLSLVFLLSSGFCFFVSFLWFFVLWVFLSLTLSVWFFRFAVISSWKALVHFVLSVFRPPLAIIIKLKENMTTSTLLNTPKENEEKIKGDREIIEEELKKAEREGRPAFFRVKRLSRRGAIILMGGELLPCKMSID